MIFIFNLPLTFYVGILTFLLLLFQITLGIMMMKGKVKLLGIHKVNAIILVSIAVIHLYLALRLYI